LLKSENAHLSKRCLSASASLDNLKKERALQDENIKNLNAHICRLDGLIEKYEIKLKGLKATLYFRIRDRIKRIHNIYLHKLKKNN